MCLGRVQDGESSSCVLVDTLHGTLAKVINLGPLVPATGRDLLPDVVTHSPLWRIPCVLVRTPQTMGNPASALHQKQRAPQREWAGPCMREDWQSAPA